MKTENTPKTLMYAWKKSIALFVSICILLLDVYAYAQIPKTIAPGVGNEQAPISIAIPEEFGTVDESYLSSQTTVDSPQKTIVYIQDAHDSLEAQENIAKIIHHLVEKGNVETVFEEGYEGKVPTDEYFGSIQDSKIKKGSPIIYLISYELGEPSMRISTENKTLSL